MTNKSPRKQRLLRQYFLNAYAIALLKEAGEAAARRRVETTPPDSDLLSRQAS